MTITERPAIVDVAVDLYRDIHKGIRAELFGLTLEAGSTDPSDRGARLRLAERVGRSVTMLEVHADHEDRHIQPSIEIHFPRAASRIEDDHERLDTRIRDIGEMADVVGGTQQADARSALRELYLELSSFTSAYLAHQDLEERLVMPGLEGAIGPDAVLAIHLAIVSSIPPDEMATSLALMIPAMNVDDRTELLGGMQATAPAEVFAGVWGLVGTVLPPADVAVLGTRLGLAG